MRATGAVLVAGMERIHFFDDAFDEIECSCCDIRTVPEATFGPPACRLATAIAFVPCMFFSCKPPNEVPHLPFLPPFAPGRVLQNKPALSRPWLGGLASLMRVPVFLSPFLFTPRPVVAWVCSFSAMHLFPPPSSKRHTTPSSPSTPCLRTRVKEQTCFEPTLAWRSCFSHARACFPSLFSFYSVACGCASTFFLCSTSFSLAKLRAIRCTFLLFHPLLQDMR